MQEVSFGDVTVPVYPQRWAYLANHVGKAVSGAFSRGETLTDSAVGDALFTLVGEGAYDVLCGLIPNLEGRMTRDEFNGETTGPTIPEIRNAFRVACEVNEINDLPGMLGKALGPTGTNYVRATLLERLADSTGSLTLPSGNGESASESSTPSDPTLTESTDSPSPESPA